MSRRVWLPQLGAHPAGARVPPPLTGADQGHPDGPSSTSPSSSRAPTPTADQTQDSRADPGPGDCQRILGNIVRCVQYGRVRSYTVVAQDYGFMKC
jgi:hypothetical protein